MRTGNNIVALLATAAWLAVFAPSAAPAQDATAIRIGVNTAIQLQVGRDTVDAVNMAIDEINANGGVMQRRLESVVADEGEAASEGPKLGIAAINKLSGEDHVDVLLGGYDSGVTLGELPHIARARTIFLGVGAASPAIQQKVKDDYQRYKYLFRVNPLNSVRTAQGLVDFIAGKLRGELGYSKIAFIGENAKWVQDVIPILKRGALDAGMEVSFAEVFDVQSSDFSPLFARVRDSGAQYLFIVISHAASDVLVKQWYDAKLPLPLGGLDIKSMDANFYERVGGKAISEVTTNFVMRAPLTSKTIPWWDRFVARYHRPPVYTAGGAYDAVYLYADAVERAGSTDTEALIKALEATDFVGVRGRVKFDAVHDVMDGPGLVNQLFVQWQHDGERAVIWPKNLATGAMINPPWMGQN
ncbi:MAG TPA: ABC transporter substrate-binding protein [Xanthobacteraceae bacterium]|nr:ABC transporter substrate-binding protein [Xanthobacteraceae bacterium]